MSLQPDRDEKKFLYQMGEFSWEKEIAFERHLARLYAYVHRITLQQSLEIRKGRC